MRLTPLIPLSVALLLGGFLSARASQPSRPKRPAASAVAVAAPTAAPTPIVEAVIAVTPPVPSPTPPHGPSLAHILMYHYIRVANVQTDPLGYRLSVTPDLFDRQLAALKGAGYHFITMAQLMAGQTGSDKVVLTFDDGYEDFYTAALPVLQKYGATATAYIITNKIGGPYMTWDQLRQAKADGVEIGAHTADHLDLSKLSVSRQQAEIEGSKRVLESNLGGPVTAFCYPSGRYDADTLRLVRQDGFASATTTNPGAVYSLSQPFTLNRVRVTQQMGADDLLRSLR